MYGQKQIIQCAAVAIVLFILSFHRSALKQNREMVKAKLRRSNELKLKLQTIQSNSDSGAVNRMGYDVAFNSNLTGYCLKNPFSKNMFGNYDNNLTHCHHNCFDIFEIWLHRRCKANCCVFKSTTSITRFRPFNVVDSMQNISTTKRTHRTHENTALTVYIEFEEKGAGLNNRIQKQQTTELINTISEPIINVQVMKPLHYDQSNEYECQNRHFNQLIIRDNTTSVNGNQIKLEKLNQSNQQIMEYHDFLFDMGIPEPKHRSSLPPDSGTIMMSIFALISFLVAMLTIRYMFKIFFFNDHTETLLRALELRRALQMRMDQITAQMLEDERAQRQTTNENGHDSTTTEENKLIQMDNDDNNDTQIDNDQSTFDQVE